MSMGGLNSVGFSISQSVSRPGGRGQTKAPRAAVTLGSNFRILSSKFVVSSTTVNYVYKKERKSYK